jgi:hypothetical protein
MHITMYYPYSIVNKSKYWLSIINPVLINKRKMIIVIIVIEKVKFLFNKLKNWTRS